METKNFDLIARNQLTNYINNFSGNSALQSVTDVTNDVRILFEEYLKAPETSYIAQSEYFEQLLLPLKNLDSSLKKPKTWWQRFIGFLGFLSPEEKSLHQAIAQIQAARTVALAQYNHFYASNFISRIKIFLEFYLNRFMLSTHYDEYTQEEKITYLSHHLMGETDLNHFSILQGKNRAIAYQHFSNDLEEFINNEQYSLDEQTKQLFNKLKQQIDNSSALVEQLDLISIVLAQSENSKDHQQQFINEFSYYIQKALYALKPGDLLLIPHGYRMENSGHATVIECNKINDSEVIFRIINTGCGEEHTESYKTMFTSIFSNSTTRPIKITSALKLEDLFSNQFIENLVSPLIINDNDAKNKMDEIFRTLYQEGKLHDDKQSLSLQTNGTCTHSSLLSWLRTMLSESTFLLFNYLTVATAQQRLSTLTQSIEADKAQQEVLTELSRAGEKTVAIAKEDFTKKRTSLLDENQQLKSQLSDLLVKKQKQLKDINSFSAYSEKKCKQKLTAEEQAFVHNEDPLSSWSALAPTNSWSWFGFMDKKKTHIALSDRAQKAILAKKIAGHDSYLEMAQPVTEQPVLNTSIQI